MKKMPKVARGRKPKPPSEVRSKLYGFKATPVEGELLEAAANRAGVTMSDWLRGVALTAARRKR